MPSKKVTRKKLKNLIKSSRTKKLPQNLKDISVKKSMKISEKNIIHGLDINILLYLIHLKKKYNNFNCIIASNLTFSIQNYIDSLVTYLYTDKNIYIKILQKKIKEYNHKKTRFIIIPIDFGRFTNFYFYYKKTGNTGHQNILIIDLKEKKAEYFEPHGGLYSKHFNDKKYNEKQYKNRKMFGSNLYLKSLQIYQSLNKILKKLKIKLILPHIYLKKYDFQAKSGNNFLLLFDKHCQIWCLWFVSLRLKYPDADLKNLMNKTRHILKTEQQFIKFISNYNRFVFKSNMLFLKQNNLDLKTVLKKKSIINNKKFNKIVQKSFTMYDVYGKQIN